MDDQRIFQGSYKQFPIFWKESTTEGGRSLVVRQFPNKTTQNVEDTGGIPRRFRMQLCVFATGSFTYFGYRNELLRVLDTQGSGVLIHPLYGRIEQVYAGKYEVRENHENFGDGQVNLVFEVSNNTGVPVETQATFTNVEALNDLFLVTVTYSFSESFIVNTAFPGNFTSATDSLSDFSSTIDTAIINKTEEPGTFEKIKSSLNTFNDSVNSYVLDPATQVNEVLSIVEQAYEVYENPRSAFEVMSGLFGFGGGNITLLQNTVGRIQRLANRILFNNMINATALSYAYQAGVQIEFETVAEVDDIRDRLNEQYETVRDSGLDNDSLDIIEQNRTTTNEILDAASLNARRLITVFTPIVPTRVLSFQYYGDENSGEQIARINSVNDVSYIEGDVSILTT